MSVHMLHPGLKLTDWTLMHPRLSQDAKLVLAATLATPGRDARQRQLADWLPLSRDTIIAAQNELEASGIVTYRRPKSRISATDARFNEGKRIVQLHPKAEPERRSGTRPPSAFLPGWLCEGIPRGRNGKLGPLYALLVGREQAQAGRSVLGDRVAASLLRDGTTERSVAAARKLLVFNGTLEVVENRRPPHLRLALDAGSDKSFDPSKVLLLHNWKRANVFVVATQPQWAYLLGLANMLPDAGIERVIEAASEADGGVPEGGAYHAKTLLKATRDVLNHNEAVGITYALGGQQTTSWGASSELDTQNSSNPRNGANTSDPIITSEDKIVLDRWLEERSSTRGADLPKKRELPMVRGGFVWATDAKWSRIESMLDAIQARHSDDHRLDMERLVVEEGYDANQLLRTMERRYHHLVPRQRPASAEEERNREKVKALLDGQLFGGADDDDDEYAA